MHSVASDISQARSSCLRVFLTLLSFSIRCAVFLTSKLFSSAVSKASSSKRFPPNLCLSSDGFVQLFSRWNCWSQSILPAAPHRNRSLLRSTVLHNVSLFNWLKALGVDGSIHVSTMWPSSHLFVSVWPVYMLFECVAKSEHRWQGLALQQ